MTDLTRGSTGGIVIEARNAFSPEMRSGLDAAFHRFENDEEVRCVVLRGAAEDHALGVG